MKKIVLFTFCFLCFLSGSYLSAEDTLKHPYYIEISVGQCKLWLYKTNVNSKPELVKEYPVGTAKKNLKKFPLGKGIATKIETNPWWYPTPTIIKEFAKRGIELPERVPPGHPLNYMGSFKIYISHSVIGKGTIYRIHGSRKEDEAKIGKRVSSGCIRMKNNDGEELIKMISMGTEVNIIL